MLINNRWGTLAAPLKNTVKLASSVSIVLMGLTASAQASDCRPVWQEEFNDPLDHTLWNTIEGDGCDLNLCGWGNEEKQTYDADALMVDNGVLKITASVDEAGTIRSGKINTAGNYSTRYGRIEARMRLPAGRGLWPAFWMMPDPHDKPWPSEGEIDILEWTGNEPHRVIGAVHFGDLWPDNVHYSETMLTPSQWSGEFHTYGVIWEPGAVHWTVDGHVHGTANADQIDPWRWVFDDKPFHLILNMAVGGTLGGPVVEDDLPATLEVDWVRVYDHECGQALNENDAPASSVSPSGSVAMTEQD